MRGSTFSPPKPSQGNNLHPLHVSAENELWPLHMPLPVTHRLHKRERSSWHPQPPAESHSLQRKGKGQLSWAELRGARAVTLGWGHTTATTLHPPSPAQCFAFGTWKAQVWSSSPPVLLLEGKEPLAFQPPHSYLSETLTGLICISAREVGRNHSHRHWSISCPWHLCGLLVQLRQQL